MSRPRILGIICCSLFASMAAISWAQVPGNGQSDGQSVTIADRLQSLKNRFSRDTSSAQESSSRTGNQRYGRTSNSSRTRRSNSPEVRRSTNSSQSANNRSTNNSRSMVARSAPTTSSVSPRVATKPKVSTSKGNRLLPSDQLFSRGGPQSPKTQSQASPQVAERSTKQFTQATNVSRAGSNTGPAEPLRVARRSPSVSRANELDAALADLLKPQSKPSLNQAVTKPAIVQSPLSKPKRATTKQRLQAATSGTFDLRKALLDDEEDSIAAEAAEAVEEVAPAEEKDIKLEDVVEPKLVEEDVEEAAPIAVKAPVEIETPKVVKSPVVETPAVAKPAAQPITPTVIAPKVVAPKVVNSPKVVSDPFEGAARKVFSQPQEMSNQALSDNPEPVNPMRAFLPTSEPVKPVQTVVTKPARGVLQTTQQPVIVSHVEGPRSILVGREATYQVTLENTSNTAASNVSAQISVPEWAELVDAMSTSGVVERLGNGGDSGSLEWNVREIAARSSQALRLRLIPRSGRPLQLGVRWTQAPVQTQAIVEVQEPKLDIAISGPKEVQYGKAQRYRLTLQNSGTGLTEKVSLRLIPPGEDAQSATTQSIGNLKPGEVRDIDLELTAREAGKLLIQASATADGGLRAEVTKDVLCRKPELQVDWRGPDKKYAGTVAAYYFRVSNPGTAATEPVNVSLKLPVGTEFVSASQGYSLNSATGVVSWRLASIDVKEEQFMQLRCKIARSGANDFQLSAKTSDGELSQSKAFQTNVIALADLKLEVRDPQGPLPVGDSVVYEIRVRNRGTTSAENINIIGLFSEGIDPTTVEGAQFSLRDGRVSFHPIKSLPAGREVLLKIHAKASQVGTHIFRTEVTCPKLDIKLAAEETTRFFEDEYRWEDGQTPYSAEREGTLSR